MKLTDHQQDVFDKIIANIENFNEFGQCFVASLNGPAGCGKTVMTSEIISYLMKNTNYFVTCTTPTHKALAVLNKMITRNGRISSKTIHSYLGLKIQYEEDKIKLAIDAISNKANIDKTKVLIIDESSMVSEELYKFIMNKIKTQKLNVVLFVGDKFQLLPVEGTENPVYSKIQQFELTEVVRQALDSSILRYATKIRKEIENKSFDMNVLLNVQEDEEIMLFDSETNMLKDFCLSSNKKDIILASFTNQKTDYYNAFIRAYEFREISPIPEYVEGEVLVLQNAYGDIKNGEEVIVTSLEKLYNESLGIYYWSFSPSDSDTFKVDIVAKESLKDFNNKLTFISDKAKTFKRDKYFKECSDMWDKFWKLKNKFAEVKHNYGSTIHKLQGSTYNETYLNLNETIKACKDKETLFRLVYVAVTRAKYKLKILK